MLKRIIPKSNFEEITSFNTTMLTSSEFKKVTFLPDLKFTLEDEDYCVQIQLKDMFFVDKTSYIGISTI